MTSSSGCSKSKICDHHVVQRWRMVDNGNTLEVLVTVDDSHTYN